MQKVLSIVVLIAGLCLGLPRFAWAGNTLDKAGSPSAVPVAAFSMRLLSSAYTGKAIQVRRSSDNTTQDIGFTANGDLDTASLLSFVGSGNGFVSIWYDQSGNGYNASQATTTNQPQVVSNGVIYRDNGRPSIYTWQNGYLTYGGMTQFNGGYAATRMSVARSRTGSGATIDGLDNYTLDCQILSATSVRTQISTGSIVVGGGTVGNTNILMTLNELRNWGSSSLYVNGNLNGTNSSALSAFGSSLTGYIGVRSDGGGQAGAFTESILFNTVLSDSDRRAVNNNQNAYYSVINPLDKIGAPGARPVTAFSLRQLGSNYTGKAIQVRRSSDNTTQDIGFTANGDLDTASLLTFVGSGNGFVSIWYDQSGNGYNATQATTTNQPQIVSNGVIYRDNGRPSIYTWQNGYLTYGGMTQFNGGYAATRMSVARSRTGSGATIDGLDNYALDCQILSATAVRTQISTGSIVVGGGTVGNTNQLMELNELRNWGNSSLYVNGVLNGTNTSALSVFGASLTGYIGVRSDLGGQAGAFTETILFDTLLSGADRQVINNSQNTYYTVINALDKAGAPTAQPVAAFGLRQLGSNYTGKLIQVRRSSDNTTQDIGFTSNGDLDTASLLTFVGSGGNGFVSIWYDQSGNGYNATQATSTNQPQIVTNGLINRDNGRPSIYTSQNGYLTYTMTQFGGGYAATRMSVARNRNGNYGATIDGLDNYALDCQIPNATSVRTQISTGSIVMGGGTVGNTTILMALSELRNYGNSKLYVDGTLNGTNTSAVSGFGTALNGYIGVRSDGGGQPGAFTESILFNTSLSDADRQAVSNNEISYFAAINPLDRIGAPSAHPAAAFSLRQLGANYTGKAIQVRRSSDNTTQDIGFTANGDLDTASLKTFVGSGNGFVNIWYDQSGNGYNATQTSTSYQPTIVTGGVINRDNGRPSIYTGPYGSLVYGGMTQFNGSYQATRMSVARSRNGNSLAIIDGLDNYTLDCQIQSSSALQTQINVGSIVVGGTTGANTNALMALNEVRNTGNSKVYVNGNVVGANTNGLSAFGASLKGYIGVRGDGGGMPGAFTESILFNTVLSDADRQSIDTSQLDYYTLVNTLDKAGAPVAQPVAAFSLRQLGTNYAGKAIQVRRSSDNTTQDIGFTTNGDLDTVSLKTFVGSGNGFVSIWYDQSGNGFNATQSTTTNQPLIVTNGVINEDNGRPSIYTWQNGYLVYGGMTQFTGYQATRMSVARNRDGAGGATIDGLDNYNLDTQLPGENTAQIQMNTGGNQVTGGTVGNNTSLMALAEQRDNGNSKMYANGALLGTSANGLNPLGVPVTGYIGVRGDLGGQAGAFTESILFATDLTDADRQKMDSSRIKYFNVTNGLNNVGVITNNPIAAFSLRLLSSGYSGKAIQVRRSSDNTTQDIGFTTNGDLDTASLKTFVGSGNGYVSIWYDQSGQNRHKTQTNASAQPPIVNAGVIYRQGGQPVIYFPNTPGVGLVGAAPDYLVSGDMSVVMTAWSNSATDTARRALQGKTQNWYVGPYDNNSAWYAGGYVADDSTQPWKSTGEVFTVVEPAGGENTFYRNGLKELNMNNTYKGLPGSICVSAAGLNNEPMNGYISELMEFNTALSQNDQNTIAQSAGGYNDIAVQSNNMEGVWLMNLQAAEAFSLRQVNTGYNGPLVRIKTGSNYYDVFPDDNGFLSMNSFVSAAYTSFNADTTGATYTQLDSVVTGSANATVAIWYDQSGRGWNALQATDANQPVLILNGAFVTPPGNNQPALLFSQASKDFLQGDSHEANGFNAVTVNAVYYQNTIGNQVLAGKDKVWNFMLGTNGMNGAGSFNSSRNGTSWSDSAARFIAVGLPSLNKANGITGQYGNTGQNVSGNGVPLATVSATLPPLGSNGTPFQISGYGGASGSNYWDGYIQEIVVTDSVLGASDLRLLTASQHAYYNTRKFISWTGANSQNWTDACSWSDGMIPTAQQSLLVPAGTPNAASVSGSTTAPDSIVVAPGAILNIGSGASFTGTLPKVVMLANANASGYVVNAAGTALGRTTIQQWFSGQQGFRVLAYPFDSTQTTFLTTAGAGNGVNFLLNSGSGSTAPSSSTPAIPNDSISDAQVFSSNAWTNMANGVANANIPYALYYRGLASAFDSLTSADGPSAFALTVSGTTNTGTSVSIPAANSTTAFTVAGNPFTAPVTTLAMTGDPSGNTSYYVWQIPVGSTATARTTDAGQWVPYLPGNMLLPVMSGMAFKQATAASTITVPTSAMGNTGTLHQQLSSVSKNTSPKTSPNGIPLEYLELETDEHGAFRDRMFLRFADNTTGNGTDQLDLEKLFNRDFDVYTLADDRADLAIDARKEVDHPVPLGIRTIRPGQYHFVVVENNLLNGADLYLRDKLLHTETQLNKGTAYDFTVSASRTGTDEQRFEIFDKTKDTAQTVTHAFSAVLLGNVVPRNEDIQVKVTNTDESQVSVELFNMSGVRLETRYIQSGIVPIPAVDLSPGMYIVRCTKGTDKIILKLIVR